MTNKSKFRNGFAVLLAITVLMAVLPVGVYSDSGVGSNTLNGLSSPQGVTSYKQVHIRVEGISRNIVDSEFVITSTSSGQTALDALKQTLEDKKVSYEIESAQYGQYIKSIKGEIAGSFGGYDGWLYLVNGSAPSVGASEYKIQTGDEVVFYYGMFPPDTLTPHVDIQPSQPGVGDYLTVTVSSSYNDWFQNRTVDIKIKNAVISFNNKIYTTDGNGQVIIKDVYSPGTYSLKVEKNSEGSYPSIVRSGDINVTYGTWKRTLISMNAKADIEKVLSDKSQSAIKNILKQDSVSDWAALALARAGEKVSEKYISSLKAYIKEQAGTFRKVTDSGRIVLIAGAAGLYPASIEGYNMIEKIYNCEEIDKQGIAGPVFALIALDSHSYGMPDNAVWTRDKLVDLILDCRNADGGFGYAKGEESDVDMTAMALQALSSYTDREDVKAAAGKAIEWLSNTQLENGGYKAWGIEGSESISQVIIALTSFGIDPMCDHFTKKDGDLLSALLTFGKEDGGFSHTREGNSDDIATEQALRALTAYSRLIDGRNRLYLLTEEPASQGDIYSDSQVISGWALQYVEKARQYNLMQSTDTAKKLFEPAKKITRAEFITILIRALGEEPLTSYTPVYKDVKEGSWYAGYVLKAWEKGIVKSASNEEFAPTQPISRQEMAVMAARAFGLTGESQNDGIKDLSTASDWARSSIVAVYNEGIMTGNNANFNPMETVTREIAAIVAVRLYEMKAQKW